MASIVKSFAHLVDIDPATELKSRLDRARILVGCDSLNNIPEKMEVIIGGDYWQISLEIESQARKKIDFQSSPELRQPTANNLEIFRWAKGSNQHSTSSRDDQHSKSTGHVAVQANSTRKHMGNMESEQARGTSKQHAEKRTAQESHNLLNSVRPSLSREKLGKRQRAVWEREQQYDQGTKERADSHARSGEGAKNPNPRSVWVADGSRKKREEERERGEVRVIRGEGCGPSPSEGLNGPTEELGQAHEKIYEKTQEEKRKDKGKEIMEEKCEFLAGTKEARKLPNYEGEAGHKKIDRINVGGGEGVQQEEMEAKSSGIQPRALGSLVKTDVPFGLENFQEVIAKAMKDAMATQLNDWFGAGHGKGLAVTSRNQERMGEVDKEGEKENGSQASFVQATNFEGPIAVHEKDVREQIGEPGSTTREILVEACEKLSRERMQKERDNAEQEKEVVSPLKKRTTPKDKEASRTSIR